MNLTLSLGVMIAMLGDKQYWEEDILPMDRCKLIKPKIEACLSQKYCWNFRRSAGQSGAINILYGILSGSIATITEGIVFSDDCAWDYDRMPIQGNEFLKTYYRPDLETNPEIKKEAKSLWILLINEFMIKGCNNIWNKIKILFNLA